MYTLNGNFSDAKPIAFFASDKQASTNFIHGLCKLNIVVIAQE